MNLRKTNPKLTVEEYFAIEREAPFKSEYHEGEMIGMAGNSEAHYRIGNNVHLEFGQQLRGKTCQPYHEVSVRVTEANYYYADLAVACPPKFVEREGLAHLTNPAVVVEVLSDSTAARDRVEKWDQYRQLLSLQEYLLVSQKEPHVLQCTRQPGGGWLQLDVLGLAASCALPCLGVTLPLALIYAGVDFKTPASEGH